MFSSYRDKLINSLSNTILLMPINMGEERKRKVLKELLDSFADKMILISQNDEDIYSGKDLEDVYE